jgi:tRNA nucleotidyltransferase (CCA-adding enzyme)
VNEIPNLVGKIQKQLPSELVEFMQRAGELTQEWDQKLYLVGGVVRDLLLRRENLDLDLVIEGDAIALASQLASQKQGRLVTHNRFGTAKLQWDGWSADLATARSETYARACALPTVNPSSIEDDLLRRDFTINAMAVELNPGCYGRLLDLHGGLKDLEGKLIRVLHEKSLVDDATRIWRAIRYEQRLDFKLEPETLRLLKRDADYLKKVSGDRIRHELELILKEEYAEKALCRADELGVLEKLHRKLKADDWLVEKYAQARKWGSPDASSPGLYLSLLVYRLKPDEVEELISYLRLRKAMAKALRDTVGLRANLERLASPQVTSGQVYALLIDYSVETIIAGTIAGEMPGATHRLNEFMNKLRYIRPTLGGEELKKLGVAQGPEIRAVLHRLLEARLDGKAATRRDEEALVEGWLAGKD